jgi:NADP-dependent 3-hydroxy acid dehydrogenase YdfG
MTTLLVTDDPSLHTEKPSLQGKNVLVTGGTTGIGRATAALLAGYGANVFLFGRHEKQLRAAIADMGRRPGKVGGVTADQSRGEEVERVFKTFDAEFGDLDILINNASVSAGTLDEADEAGWRYQLETDLFGYIDCTRRALQRMRARGSGHIVNIGSIAAENYTAGLSLYVAAKSAIRGFSRSLRKEVSGDGIKVSLVEPGMVGTEIFEADEPEADPATQRREQTRGAMLKPEDIAVAVHYVLTQPERCNVTQLLVEPLVRD